MSFIVNCLRNQVTILQRNALLCLQRNNLANKCACSSSTSSLDNPQVDEKAAKQGNTKRTDDFYRRRVNRRDLRFIFPEFLPDPNPDFRNQLVERLVRKDMLRRRKMVELPEFYVGSIISVQYSDFHVPSKVEKTSKFVGICIARGGTGLRAWFIVRNVIDKQGVEFLFYMYSPTILKVEVLKLEKRLDHELYYLRDAPHEYSTVPMDMKLQILPEGSPVPINDMVVPLNPAPWHRNWHLYEDRHEGYSYDASTLTVKAAKRHKKHYMYQMINWQNQVLKYDLMLTYNETIPIEVQDAIWEEVADELEERDKAMRKVAAKRVFTTPQKEF